MDPNFTKILDLAIEQKASDILFQTGQKPVIRVNGKLMLAEDAEVIQLSEDAEAFKDYMNKTQYEYYLKHGSSDFGFSHGENNRFRGNIYRQQNGISISLRLIRNNILSFEDLNLPPIFKQIAEDYKQGFFLIVGPTGHGKSTSIASIINYINKTRESHIITIEDPIEYIFKNDKSIIEQREVGTHASSFDEALRTCMRQDPDIIMVGEMRDYETMQTAVTLAETGHLVFSTIHTNNAAQTIDRIIDTFPEHKQKQVRIQLSNTLSGIISQRLVPGVDGGLIFAHEQVIVNDAVRNIIRTEQSEQIYNALQSDESEESAGKSMVRLEQCLARLIKEEKITKEMALTLAPNRGLIDIFMEYN